MTYKKKPIQPTVTLTSLLNLIYLHLGQAVADSVDNSKLTLICFIDR